MSDDPKLIELRPEFRNTISDILDALVAQGFHAKISNAYRTQAQQLEKVKEGYANPSATSPGAHGWGLAADIIDRRYAWEVSEHSAKFFAALGDLAMAAGCTWGGAWFGAGGTSAHPTHKACWNKWGIGWDPAHVQMGRIRDALKQDYGPGNREEQPTGLFIEVEKEETKVQG